MLTPRQVLAIANKEVKKQPVIARWQAVYHGISLHTLGAAPAFQSLSSTGGRVEPPNYYGPAYQDLFDKFLLNRHPRENEKTRNWRYSQYRPFTKGPFNKIIEAIQGGIFQDNNWNIEIQNDEDAAYISGNNFDGFDLVSFFASAMRFIVEDPNGCFVCLPSEAFNATTTQDVRPVVWKVPSTDIWHRDADDLLFTRDGLMWWVTKQAFFRLSHNADGLYSFTADSAYYAHMLGELPVQVCGGEPNSRGFYESYIDKAKAWADEFISAKSAEQLVDKEASHPFIVQAQTECPTCKGNGQVQEPCDSCPSGYELENCEVCRGSGWISNNPGERLLVPPDQMDKKQVDIISPNTSINALHGEKTNAIYQKLLDELNLLKVDASQSGVAKALDMERFYLFISRISNDIFDRLIYKTLGYIVAYRNVVATREGALPQAYAFTVIKPQQFSIKTASDLLDEYEAGLKAQLPAVVRQRQLVDFSGKQFGGDDLQRRKTFVATEIDPLCVYTPAEKQAQVLSGAVELRDVQFSTRLPYLLSKLVRSNAPGWLLETDVDAIEEAARGLFNTLFPENATIPYDDKDQ